MRVLSLFAGIGGFDLAAHWMGWATAVFVEWEDFPRQVLIKNFKCVPVEQLSAANLAAIIDQWRAWNPGQPQPISVLYGDICHFDARLWLGAIDLVCGGFPCQPFSSAGAGLGVEDARHLWPQMLRVICEVRALHVVGENVRGLLTKHPLQFEAVCASLEAEGYDVQPFLLPAASVGAPHERYRFWFVAHAHDGQRLRPQQQVCTGRHAAGLCGEADADASSPGRQESYAPGFAAKPGLGAWGSHARPVANTTGQRCEAGRCGGVCERTGQGRTSQRDSQRTGFCPATDGRSTLFTHSNGDQCRPVSDLLRGEFDFTGRIARDAPGVPSNVGTPYARHRRARQRAFGRAGSSSGSRAFRLTKPALRGTNDGVPAELVRLAGNSKEARKLARRIEKLDATLARNSLKGYGNAIVPQVAYRFFQAIAAVEDAP